MSRIAFTTEQLERISERFFGYYTELESIAAGVDDSRKVLFGWCTAGDSEKKKTDLETELKETILSLRQNSQKIKELAVFFAYGK